MRFENGTAVNFRTPSRTGMTAPRKGKVAGTHATARGDFVTIEDENGKVVNVRAVWIEEA